jgi:hypothetical protein
MGRSRSCVWVRKYPLVPDTDQREAEPMRQQSIVAKYEEANNHWNILDVLDLKINSPELQQGQQGRVGSFLPSLA